MSQIKGILANLFTAPQLPLNLKLRRLLRYNRVWHFLHLQAIRLCDFLTLLKCWPSTGYVNYRREDVTRTLRFNARNGQFHSIYDAKCRSGYEFETSSLLLQLCQGNSVFYDVGANWGYFEFLLAASPWFSGKCYAFEPNPEVFKDLVSMLQQAELDDFVQAVNIGIGAQDCEMSLNLPSRYETGLGELTSESRRSRITVKKLDSLNFEPPSIIKIDVEGMETEVCMGAERTLREQRPFLLFENFLNFSEPLRTTRPFTFLSALGYRFFNPTCIFRYSGCEVMASQNDPFYMLTGKDENPKTVLVPIDVHSRFLLRYQINVFACHHTRLDELNTKGIALLDVLSPPPDLSP